MPRSGCRSLPGASFLMLVMVVAAGGAGGCATKRPITITTAPPDGLIKIDGIDLGRAPVSDVLVFKNKQQTHVVTASRLGYREQAVPLKSDFRGSKLQIDMKPFTARITINVAPVPAKVFIDGRQ